MKIKITASLKWWYDKGKIFEVEFIERKVNGVWVLNENNDKVFLCYEDFNFVDEKEKEWVMQQPIQW